MNQNLKEISSAMERCVQRLLELVMPESIGLAHNHLEDAEKKGTTSCPGLQWAGQDNKDLF